MTEETKQTTTQFLAASLALGRERRPASATTQAVFLVHMLRGVAMDNAADPILASSLKWISHEGMIKDARDMAADDAYRFISDKTHALVALKDKSKAISVILAFLSSQQMTAGNNNGDRSLYSNSNPFLDLSVAREVLRDVAREAIAKGKIAKSLNGPAFLDFARNFYDRTKDCIRENLTVDGASPNQLHDASVALARLRYELTHFAQTENINTQWRGLSEDFPFHEGRSLCLLKEHMKHYQKAQSMGVAAIVSKKSGSEDKSVPGQTEPESATVISLAAFRERRTRSIGAPAPVSA